MSDNVTRRAFSRDEIQEAARVWMVKEFGRPVEMTSERRIEFYVMLGVFVSFIVDTFPEAQR
jgi:hypothetical protein